MHTFEIRHAHFFCGLGSGAAGFNAATPMVPGARGRMRCLGGIDVSPAAIADFKRLTGVRGTVLDLFDRRQYRAFHGKEPPAEWREAGIADIHASFGHERPHIIFLSAPCKGFSGLMSEGKSRTDKYQALNELTLRGVWLMLEAYHDDPVEMIVFENVPRIMTRGRHLLDQSVQLLQRYGYVVNETTHDCGEIGGLAQSRKRFLLVARHAAKVPSFLYEPEKRPLRAVGEVLGRMPFAGDVGRAGPMHRVPALQWKTWVRLAFVEAGRDWRSLDRLAIENGHLRDYLIVPDRHRGFLGVRPWDEPSGTVAGRSLPTNGAFSVADPRAPAGASQYQQYGVLRMEDTAGAVIGVKSPGQGTFSVADPRFEWSPNTHCNKYRIVPYGSASGTVTGSDRVGSGAPCVADPRVAPADAADAEDAEDAGLPHGNQNMVCVIRSQDGTWHRPFTTLELAALQSMVEPEEKLELDGLSDQAWRERIGNAVPKYAATAIGEQMGRTLLLAWTGQTFALSNTPIWVRDVAVALALPARDELEAALA